MWCPEGFLHWFEISNSIEIKIDRAFSNSHYIRDNSLELLDRQKLYQDISEYGWASFMEECPSFGVVSDTGKYLRIWGLHIGLRLKEPTFASILTRQLVFIDEETGLIETGSVEARIRNAEKMIDIHQNTPALGDQITISEDDFAQLSLLVGAKVHLPIFKKFDGWAVCCREEHHPDYFLAGFEEDWAERKWNFKREYETIDVSEYLTGTVGRPRTQEVVAKAYKKLFPNGHGNKSWKQVLSALEQDGTFTSEPTLRRALGRM